MKQAYETANDNIQTIADRFEINNLLLDLATAIDNKALQALDDIFTSDALVQYKVGGGKNGQHAELKKLLAQMPPYLVANVNIPIDGDTASGTTLCHCPAEQAGQARCYVDQFRRTDAGWRIVRRVQAYACPGS